MIYDLVIIGAGISGLTAAIQAQHLGLEDVILLDYQKSLGGFTRPYWVTGEFARENEILQKAAELPYEIRTETTVVGYFPGQPHQLYVQSPGGTDSIEARHIFIASGALEKPREAHRIPGSRPAGVMTPMMAAQLLDRGYLPGHNIVLMESGRISRGAASLLGEKTEGIQVYADDAWELRGVAGFARLEKVSLLNRKSGKVHDQECDTLIYSKGRIPSTFFLKGTPVVRDEHDAVVVDKEGRTSLPGVFAAGSCTTLGQDNHENSALLATIAMNTLLKEW